MAGRLPGLSAVTTTRVGRSLLGKFSNLGFFRCFPNKFDPGFFFQHLKKQPPHQFRLVRQEDTESLDPSRSLSQWAIKSISFKPSIAQGPILHHHLVTRRIERTGSARKG